MRLHGGGRAGQHGRHAWREEACRRSIRCVGFGGWSVHLSGRVVCKGLGLDGYEGVLRVLRVLAGGLLLPWLRLQLWLQRVRQAQGAEDALGAVTVWEGVQWRLGRGEEWRWREEEG